MRSLASASFNISCGALQMESHQYMRPLHVFLLHGGFHRWAEPQDQSKSRFGSEQQSFDEFNFAVLVSIPHLRAYQSRLELILCPLAFRQKKRFWKRDHAELLFCRSVSRDFRYSFAYRRRQSIVLVM
jgi:hypothetical protein